MVFLLRIHPNQHTVGAYPVSIPLDIHLFFSWLYCISVFLNPKISINVQWNNVYHHFPRENHQKRVIFQDFPVIFQIFCHLWFLCRLQHLQASAAPLVPPGGHGPFSQSYAGYCYLVVWNLEDFFLFSQFSHFFGTRTPTDVHSLQGSKPQTNMLV